MKVFFSGNLSVRFRGGCGLKGPGREVKKNSYQIFSNFSEIIHVLAHFEGVISLWFQKFIFNIDPYSRPSYCLNEFCKTFQTENINNAKKVWKSVWTKNPPSTLGLTSSKPFYLFACITIGFLKDWKPFVESWKLDSSNNGQKTLF